MALTRNIHFVSNNTLCICIIQSNNETSWILDGRATNHMTPHLTSLNDVHTLKTTYKYDTSKRISCLDYI